MASAWQVRAPELGNIGTFWQQLLELRTGGPACRLCSCAWLPCWGVQSTSALQTHSRWWLTLTQ